MRKTIGRIICLFTLAVVPVSANFPRQIHGTPASDCSQTTEVQNAIVREAERDRYTTRRVEFIGNQRTRDNVLRSRINVGLQEGEFFTRRNLNQSLRNVNKLNNLIYRVTTADVVLHLNPSEKAIDVIICFKEKEGRKSKRVG